MDIKCLLVNEMTHSMITIGTHASFEACSKCGTYLSLKGGDPNESLEEALDRIDAGIPPKFPIESIDQAEARMNAEECHAFDVACSVCGSGIGQPCSRNSLIFPLSIHGSGSNIHSGSRTDNLKLHFPSWPKGNK